MKRIAPHGDGKTVASFIERYLAKGAEFITGRRGMTIIRPTPPRIWRGDECPSRNSAGVSAPDSDCGRSQPLWLVMTRDMGL
jgi:hypothetical protein